MATLAVLELASEDAKVGKLSTHSWVLRAACIHTACFVSALARRALLVVVQFLLVLWLPAPPPGFALHKADAGT